LQDLSSMLLLLLLLLQPPLLPSSLLRVAPSHLFTAVCCSCCCWLLRSAHLPMSCAAPATTAAAGCGPPDIPLPTCQCRVLCARPAPGASSAQRARAWPARCPGQPPSHWPGRHVRCCCRWGGKDRCCRLLLLMVQRRRCGAAICQGCCLWHGMGGVGNRGGG
jgi:hypothetical protein